MLENGIVRVLTMFKNAYFFFFLLLGVSFVIDFDDLGFLFGFFLFERTRTYAATPPPIITTATRNHKKKPIIKIIVVLAVLQAGWNGTKTVL